MEGIVIVKVDQCVSWIYKIVLFAGFNYVLEQW